MKTDTLAWVIKVAAIVTAAPRWIGALLAAEGFALPAEWLVWWVPVSAVLSACMAVVEGLAFAYVFEAWRNQTDSHSKDLLWFALISAVIFVVVLAPYIAASVTHVTLASILAWQPALYGWSVCVGLSTIAIVASVGYAQKRKAERKTVVYAVEDKRIAPQDALQAKTDAAQMRNDAVQEKVNALQGISYPVHKCKACGEYVRNPGNHARWECSARKARKDAK